MKHRTILILFILLIFQLALQPLMADKDGKSGLKFKFSERFRFVSWDNAIDLDDYSKTPFTFTRHRTSAQLQWITPWNVEFVAKLTNEFRVYLSPNTIPLDMNEIFVDNLYVKWKHAGFSNLTLTIGRQNIMLGEGFVVMDGQPLTGSRSIYFNAARFDLAIASNQTLTGFISQVPEYDTILPIINKFGQRLEEQEHMGLGLYYTGKFKKAQLEGYYVYKRTYFNENIPVESKISTVGSRIIARFCSRTSLTAEGAYQFGYYGSGKRSAFGGHFHLDYKIPESIPVLSAFTVGGILLTGDDPNTPQLEEWDPVFSRWPKWSESYIYTLIRERGVAKWSNLRSMYLSLLATFGEDVNLKLSYFKLCALQYPISDPTFNFPGGNGKDRGHLLIGRLSIKINKYLSSHFVWEYFKPGNFYFDGADSYHWLRYELMLNL